MRKMKYTLAVIPRSASDEESVFKDKKQIPHARFARFGMTSLIMHHVMDMENSRSGRY
jgi:hypothetical protein